MLECNPLGEVGKKRRIPPFGRIFFSKKTIHFKEKKGKEK
jgi:hypothetical protein